MLRAIGGAIAGVIVAFLVVAGFEQVAHAAIQTTPAEAPLWVLAVVMLAWFAGPLLGGLAANRIGQRRWPAALPTAFILFGSIFTVAYYPHPLWMQIGAVVAPLFGGLLAWRFSPLRPETIA